MDETPLITLAPVSFFEHSIDVRHIEIEPLKTIQQRLAIPHYLMPDLSSLCCERAFANVYLGWNTEGLAFHIHVKEPFQRAFYPQIERGDSIELMMDTRDFKNSGYNTRFCHHFFCLAESVEGRQAGEKTHFRTEEESHPLCNGDSLFVHSSCHSHSYSVTLMIPAACLVGYEPFNFNRLGFTYRINRFKDAPQHFCAMTQEFQIEQYPSLWSSLQLVS